MRIYADSACDLPKSFYEQNNVKIIPLRVQLKEQEYDDIIGVDIQEVYDAIREGELLKTSQASPERFLEEFSALGQSGDEGIYIAFSSQLSGTYSTAVMMAEQVKEKYPDLKLTIIDSKCASLGYGLLVKEAVRLREEGFSANEIAEKIRFNAQHMEHLFTVEDLNYLAKGGRLSKASAFIGGLLSIKPVLDVEDGKLIPIEKYRGRKKVFKRIIELMRERGDCLSDQVIAISHSDDLAAAEEMKALIIENFHPKAVEIHLIGSVIAAHTGTGTIAIFFLNKLVKD
ncbi:DegV family protein [Rummeliibacillus pycnus]|uniref:DegV family protein n=1 Tax=Rummeliibacillus pycnus TaxID=101070 RepID=UPI000C9B42DE|nr:DegV family protein [Rummeliibacillus pycnus]